MKDRECVYLKKFLKEKGCHLTRKTKSEFLMFEGDVSEEVYVLNEGIVKASSQFHDGREFNILYISHFDFVSLLEDRQGLLFNVRVESDFASFYCIPRKTFNQWLQEDRGLAQIVNNFYQQRLVDNVRHFAEVTMNGKKGALYSCLYHLTQTFGIQKEEGILIDLPITNETLGNFCGISEKSSVNRLLRELQKEGSIDTLRDCHIIVYDLELLKDFTFGGKK